MAENNNTINVTLNSPIIETTITPNAQIQSTVITGGRGYSAYEIWLKEGHTGTEADFLSWLKNDSYVHDQLSSSEIWTINHNLGKYPSVTIVDSANSWVIGEVTYINENQLMVQFTATFAGKAYLN